MRIVRLHGELGLAQVIKTSSKRFSSGRKNERPCKEKVRRCTEGGRTEIKNSVGMILEVLIAFLWFVPGIIISNHGVQQVWGNGDGNPFIGGGRKIQRACEWEID